MGGERLICDTTICCLGVASASFEALDNAGTVRYTTLHQPSHSQDAEENSWTKKLNTNTIET